jgi:hypothetical protein
MALTEEQRQRKNEMAKLNRAKKKATKAPVVEYESENNEPIEDDVKDEVQEVEKVEVEVEDPEIARKKAIADKRRESLTLARSKIKPKSQITKEKDNEIAIMKAENEKLKAENAKVLAVKPQVTRQPVQPVRQRPIRREPRQEREREPSMDYLADQNYGEQLRERHKHNMYQRMMSDTFM